MLNDHRIGGYLRIDVTLVVVVNSPDCMMQQFIFRNGVGIGSPRDCNDRQVFRVSTRHRIQ